MKKLILITGIVVYALFAVAMIADSGRKDKPVVEKLSETFASETIAQTEKFYSYLLKSSGGKIAVLDNKTGKIIKKTDTLISVLPEKDQQMLKKGIKVESDTELRLLLEDFCS